MISGNRLLRPLICYALLVRALALVLGQFTPEVRMLGSQPPLREPGNYN